ncbi:hypothetical protein HHI36_014619 [Cryptolaemus montrouzieri]|uniref:Uncharacterized protein n=1 Tax=Cryptolaemus montrouzieri TaxID=559131 RepID=A0ABD2N345_9CUCU
MNPGNLEFTEATVCNGMASEDYYTIKANYMVTSIEPGIYVEHIGRAYIDGETFRLLLSFSIIQQNVDYTNVNEVISQFLDSCNQAENHASVTHCLDLSHHLVELWEEISLSIASLNDFSNSRRKRGLLRKFLTSLFGVNDEVYRDIDAPNENQERLIETTNRQSKLIVSGKVAREETERRINPIGKRSKVNQGIKAIGEMAKWYKISVTNQVYAHLHIIENDKFEVTKTTAPMKKQNGLFVGIQVSTSFLTVNYDTQKHFEISNDQVFQAISVGENTYIYDPTIIKSMDKNPNCIIDQIYRRVENPVCRNIKYTVKTIAWKELHKSNTWLFIANVPSKSDIICEGRRQEVTSNKTEILSSKLYHKNETKYGAMQGNRNILSHWNP